MKLDIIQEHAVRQGKLRRILEGESKSVISHLVRLWLYPHAMYHTRDHWMHEVETFINDIPELKSGGSISSIVAFNSIWESNKGKVKGIIKSVVTQYSTNPNPKRRLFPFDGYRSDESSMLRRMKSFMNGYSELISNGSYTDPEEIDDLMLINGFITGEEFNKRNS